ncbi:MAG: acetate--CoA ligase family protein [Gammaproteobacteria bacterium]
MAPKSIAVVGGQSAEMVATQCQRIGFSGALYAVNPVRSKLAGITCFPSLENLPEVPDACFLGVSPERSIALIETLSFLGAQGAVCYASGFAEAGDKGALLQKQLVSAAGPMPVVGPNCHGFINYLDGVALWPDHFGGQRTDKGPALLMQSGNIAINVTFQQRELEFAYVVAMGNNAQLGVHDYIHAMLDDPRVTAIGLHLEGIGDVAHFSEAALRALQQRVPLVALKTGSSELGADMALSHTRSLSSPDDLVSLMFERFGIARCRSLPEFLETIKLVSLGGAITSLVDSEEVQLSDGSEAPVNSPTAPVLISSMSCSGGEASHLADLVGPRDIEFAGLSDSTVLGLSEVLGERVRVSNPLDYHTYAWGDEPVLTKAFTKLLTDKVDCALLILDYPPPNEYDVTQWEVAERALCDASIKTGTRVVVVSSLPENFPACARARLVKHDVAPMQGLLECVQAMVHARTIGRAQEGCASLEPVKSMSVYSGSRRVLDELASKAELAAFGLAVPKAMRCAPEEAARTAVEIGFPVVVKALGEELIHKTELSAVRVGLESLAEVARHAKELGDMSNEVLVESMVGDVMAELIVGVISDPDFGLVLTLGSGGVLVELVNDTVQLLLPVSRESVLEALLSLKVGSVLSGFRGEPAANIDSVVEAVVSISNYAWANREALIELDVNPLLVRRNGSREGAGDISSAQGHKASAVAVDALICLKA